MEKKLLISGGAAAAAACAVFAAAVWLGGFGLFGFARYLAACALILMLPGFALARMLVKDVCACAYAGLSYCLGAAFLFVNFAAAGLLGLPVWAMFVLPCALGLWGAARLWRERKPVRLGTHHALLLWTGAALAFLCVFLGVLPFAHASAAGNMQYHQDMMWSVGNAAAVRYGFPLADIRCADGFLNYHYLSDALAGFLALFSGTAPYDALCAYHYALLLPVLVCSVYAAARGYGAKPLTCAVLPAAVVLLSGAGVAQAMLCNLNGVAAASLIACTALTLVFRNSSDAKGLEAFALVILTALMSKNLYGMLIVCALAAAFVFALIVQRRALWRAGAMALSGAALFAAVWVLLYSKAINNLVFEPWCSPARLLETLGTSMPLGLLLWAAAVVCGIAQARTLELSRLTVHAAAAGGFLAYALFYHYSASHTYFLYAGMLFAWFAALGARLPGRLRGKTAVKRAAVFLCALAAAAGFALSAPALAQSARHGVQTALRCAQLRPEFPAASDSVTAGDEEAVLWLRDNMRDDEVFAVNRNAKDMAVGEGTWHYYTAMSGKQAYVESWRYAMDYGYEYHELRRRLEDVSDVLFAQTDAADAFAIARENGIDWLFVSKAVRAEGFAGAQPAFENSAAYIYRVE